MGLENLPVDLQEVARLRAQRICDYSIQQLAGIWAIPDQEWSQTTHWRRINKIADEYKTNESADSQCVFLL